MATPSLAMIPSGYKEEKLYSFLPVPSYSDVELVTNGDFDTASDWSGAQSISGGQLTKTSGGLAYQSGVITAGKSYKIIVDVDTVGANSQIYAGGNSSSNLVAGVQTVYLTAGSSNAFFGFNNGDTSTVYNSVSVKEALVSDGDFTFSRGSNATRVNKDGLIETVPLDISNTELITNGTFDTDSDWTKETGWSISGGSLNASATTLQAFQINTGIVTNKTYKVTYTISNYVSGSVRIELGSFNVSVGAERSANGTYTEYIMALGNESVLFDGITSFTGSIDNVSVKEVTGYNKPRLDYTDSSCPSLLLEPTRTNLLPYSEDYSTSTYNAIGSVVTESNQIDPRGTNTAYKLTNFASTNDRLDGNSTMTAVDGVTYTYSAYYKGSGTIRINCSTTTGVGGGGEKDILLTDEWKKEEISFTASNPTGAVKSHVAITRTANNDAIVYVAFSQIEQGSYATSYIPTTNGIIKTRLQDECTDAGDSSTFNSEEGVLYCEISALADDNTVDKRLSISDGTNNNRVLINIGNGISNTYTYYYAVSGSNQINRNISVTDITVSHKLAVTWKVNEFKIYLDGILNYTKSSGSVNPAGTFTQIQFTDGKGTSSFFGKCKDLRVYNTALTDLEIEEISSWESFTAMANGQNYTIK